MLVITLPGVCHVVVNGKTVWYQSLKSFYGKKLSREDAKHFHKVSVDSIPHDAWMCLLADEDAIFTDPVRRALVKREYVDVRTTRAVKVDSSVQSVRAHMYDPEAGIERTGTLVRTDTALLLRLDRPITTGFIPFGLPVMTAFGGERILLGFALFANGALTVVPADRVQPSLCMASRAVSCSGGRRPRYYVNLLPSVAE